MLAMEHYFATKNQGGILETTESFNTSLKEKVEKKYIQYNNTTL